MEIFIRIAQFIVSFSLIVLIHELGHFMFARMFGVKVEKFYLFFNPWFSLVKFTYKGTEYGIGWVPFGGYCKIAGMIDESMDTESMKKPAQPYEFRSKPAWQRLLIMVGGALMNIVLAVVVYIGMNYAWGRQYLYNPDLVHGSVFNELAHEIGFKDGDRIVSVQGEQFEDYNDIYYSMLVDMASQIEVIRDAERKTVCIDDKYRERMNGSVDFMQPRVRFMIGKVENGSNAEAAGLQKGDIPIALNSDAMSYHDQYVAFFTSHPSQTVQMSVKRDSAGTPVIITLPVLINDKGMIGVANSGVSELPIHSHRYSFLQSIPVGFERTGNVIVKYWKQLRMIFNPKTKAYKQVGGVFSIANLFPNSWNWQPFWEITAFVSIVLAIMNMLPLPVLDGGHVMFLFFEVVTGRKPSDKFLERAQIVGILILFTVLLLANGNDIYRLFIK